MWRVVHDDGRLRVDVRRHQGEVVVHDRPEEGPRGRGSRSGLARRNVQEIQIDRSRIYKYKFSLLFIHKILSGVYMISPRKHQFFNRTITHRNIIPI